MVGKWWLILFILLGFSSYGQYVYTYTDPCTGILNSVTINQPSGSVTLFYAGQYQTFTQAQLQAGAFELWVLQINALAPPGSNPCAGAGGTISTGSNASTGTNTATNVSGIIGIATGISGNLGGSAASAGTGGMSTNTGGSNGSSSNNDNGNGSSGNSSSGNSSTGGSSTGGSGSSSSGGGNTGNSGGSGSTGGSGGSGGTSSGGSNGSGGGQSGDNSGSGIGGGGDAGGVDVGGGGTTETGGTETGAAGGTENTTTASGGDSESSSDGGGGGSSQKKSKQEKIGRGSLIGTGDFVVIRNSNDIKTTGMDNFKFNMSVTHVNTKQTFIKGANFNYTTGENTGNLTLYGSYKHKGFMGVFSNSTMSNFRTDIFNTTTLLAAQKLWIVTPMLGTNFTIGQIGDSEFQNWSIVGGGFTNFKGFQALSGNVMLLGIYSPYIFYYEGQWYKSGLLFVPLANVDFKVTNTFKWSISFGGAYQWQANILNFQLSTGAKMLL